MHQLHLAKTTDSTLSRMDPRLKLLSALALLVMVLSGTGFAFPLLMTVSGIIISISMKISPKSLALRFSEPGLIILMIVLLKAFFTGQSEIFSFDIFGLEVAAYKEGLVDGLLIATRILGAVSIVALLGFATPFTELMAALAWLRVPQSFIDITLFAWRYLFLLSDDARVIYQAQKNRLGYTGYRQGLRSFGTLTGALVIKAFDNSRNVTTAMVQRGYDGSMPMLKHSPFKASEVVASFILVGILGIMWQIM